MTETLVKTVCPYCGVGCGMRLHVTEGRVTQVSGDPDHPTNRGRLCTKGLTSFVPLHDAGRLDAAYVRHARQREPARLPLRAAIHETARRLRAVLDEHGPDAVSFYVSGQMSLEAQYLINKLAKGYVGTNNIDSNSRLCMSSAASGYKQSLGADAPPGSYDDFDHADVFFVIGANMAECHPILFLRMMDRVKAGAKLIVVDPRRTPTADKADLFLQLRAGTDLALMNGLLHLLMQRDALDRDFIHDCTDGWEALEASLADYTPEAVERITGVGASDLRRAAEWIATAGNWMSCWTMGLNQSTQGTANTSAICNLHLATGALCRTGSGPFSLTGQPNAMGGREVGYLSSGLPGQRSVESAPDRAAVENLWDLPPGSISATSGPDAVELFERMAQGTIRACWIICTNPVASVANRNRVIEALERAELVIAQDAFLDTETNRYADVLLPAALWAEGEGVMVNSERNLTLMRQAVEPPGDARPDWWLIAEVACAMGYERSFRYASAAEVFDEIRRSHNGHTGYDIRGVSHERLRSEPVQWPCAPEGVSRNPIRYVKRGASTGTGRPRFATANGRARFIVTPYVGTPAELEAGPAWVLNTGRLAHQWHTMTKTGKVAALNRLNPGPTLELHPEDAGRLRLGNGDRVEVRSPRGHAILPVRVSPRVRVGECFSAFHWNDVFGEALAINAVTDDARDPVSRQPGFKYCIVALAAVAPEAAPMTLLDELAQLRQAESKHASVAPPARREKLAQGVGALATQLGLDLDEVPVLDEEERSYLAAFFQGLTRRADGCVALLPHDAPLPLQKRHWVNGLMAGLLNPGLSVPETGPTVQVLWASQTGNAEKLAQAFAARLRSAGCSVQCDGMDTADLAHLASQRCVIFVTSTYGDGDAPDNGGALWDQLRGAGAGDLTALRYAVCALGDPAYDQFCAHGRRLDARLSELGAQALVQRLDCERHQDGLAMAWLQGLFSPLGLSDEQQQMGAAHGYTAPAPETVGDSLARACHSRLVANLRLNAGSANKETRYFSLATGDSGLEYEVGDALGVMPTNCPELVEEFVALSGIDGAARVHVDGRGEMPVTAALLREFEIGRPTLDTLRYIARRTQSSELKALLGEDQKEALKSWLWGRQLVDVLHEFPASYAADELPQMLKKLQPRLYSISSSPRAHPGEVHLTVAAVRYRGPRGLRKGVSSTFLADRAQGRDVPVFVQRAGHFRLPADGDTPIIMVGPGTGIAPFRAFLHERRVQGARGRNWLFFGEQHSLSDFYYREELEAWRKDGLLTRLSLAFSRDQDHKVYVQDRMREYGAELWRWLQEGAQLYVCGDASRMAKDVDLTLRQIAVTQGGLSEQQAASWLRTLAAGKRYLRDVY